jgi:hypothetical protein
VLAALIGFLGDFDLTDRGPLQRARQPDRLPVVELSRAVAVAEADGPAAGLAIVERLALEDYRYDDAERRLLQRSLDDLLERSADVRRRPPAPGGGALRRPPAPRRARRP